MSGVEIEFLLKRCIGLDSASIGSPAVERAVQERMRASRQPDKDAYFKQLRGSAAELQELIEAVVVPETWFFRHREAFDWLVKLAREHGREYPERLLRILSLPCSTGEEPYSIAMALFDAGLPASRFLVDAVDISGVALARAARAVYGKNSFRGSHLGFRDRYFAPTESGFRLSDSVVRCVRFQQANVFDPAFSPGASTYDVIFCRNMLIYFDSATQQRAVGLLSKLLSDGGTLFVGPSEGNLLLEQGYVSARAPLSFAFRRETTTQQDKTPAPRLPTPRREPASERSKPVPSGRAEATARAPASPSGGARIDQVRSLADRGHLAEAARLCESYLRDHGSSAEGQHLLGVIREATGNHQEAAAHYRKALYLNPNHYEALAHLALLLERQGDSAGARLLHDRVRRLEQRQSA